MSRFFSPLPQGVQDAALLIARLLVGSVLVAHGWQKFNEYTLAGTAGAFEQMGVPAPNLTAAVAAVIELGAGALILAGLLTSVAGVLVALNMAGAYLFVHKGLGVYVENGGYELVAVIAAASLALAAVGPGRISLDALIARPSTRAEEKVAA
ncbi:DoxX family protein [Nocardioides limicola]|uniref:DoxX family protein n=1 Tax=Nocardioides limicola TaxID=2803368 RepID=UPI00193B2E87|nr:DoxX family protein [Nocardioides sp. DJM-14]